MVFQAQYSEEPTLKGFYLFHRDLTFAKISHTTFGRIFVYEGTSRRSHRFRDGGICKRNKFISLRIFRSVMD